MNSCPEDGYFNIKNGMRKDPEPFDEFSECKLYNFRRQVDEGRGRRQNA